MIRFLTGLILSVLLAAWTPAGAEEPASWTGWPKDWAPQSTAQYPPYPDVWWRETPAAKGTRWSHLYGADGNDPLVLHYWTQAVGGETHMQAQEFFSGRTWEPYMRNGEPTVEPFGKHHPGDISLTPFPDGSTLRFVLPFKIDSPHQWLLSCFTDEVLELRNKEGRVVWRRLLIEMLDHPRDESFGRRSCGAIPEGEGVDTHFFVSAPLRWQPLWLKITSSDTHVLMLKDGTFLANPSGYVPTSDAYVIRFDMDLRSPFLEQHDGIHVVDMEELRPMLALAKQYEDEHYSNPLGYFEGLLYNYLQTRGSPYPKN